MKSLVNATLQLLLTFVSIYYMYHGDMLNSVWCGVAICSLKLDDIRERT